ncbi:hypothetical protein H4P12_00205 [Paracoccus sp. 11-3]|uniref:Uncharacterized protein n=1 Tax=Paracoccus amoyensis TaxID=2760093 RepID=A0A926J4L7_9RHOB|nr:hypothetical protein [Paracoccus amoyensis]MBC9245167.1 hypothetical protein [Paracoccus amoyensis]
MRDSRTCRLANDTLKDGIRNDTLRRGRGNDTVLGNDGLAGNDLIAGGTGRDVVIYRYSHGVDVITDFPNNVDTIQIIKPNLDSWAELRPYMSASGANVVINFG